MSNTPQNNTYMQKRKKVLYTFTNRFLTKRNSKPHQCTTDHPQYPGSKDKPAPFLLVPNDTFKAQKHICIFPLQFCFPGFINCQFSNTQQKRQKPECWFTIIIPLDSINKDWKGKTQN